MLSNNFQNCNVIKKRVLILDKAGDICFRRRKCSIYLTIQLINMKWLTGKTHGLLISEINLEENFVQLQNFFFINNQKALQWTYQLWDGYRSLQPKRHFWKNWSPHQWPIKFTYTSLVNAMLKLNLILLPLSKATTATLYTLGWLEHLGNLIVCLVVVDASSNLPAVCKKLQQQDLALNLKCN